MKLSKSQLNTLAKIQELAATSECDEALKRGVCDKTNKVLQELSREPAHLAAFFAAVELSVSESAAKLIAKHVMRPAETTALVQARNGKSK